MTAGTRLVSELEDLIQKHEGEHDERMQKLEKKLAERDRLLDRVARATSMEDLCILREEIKNFNFTEREVNND